MQPSQPPQRLRILRRLAIGTAVLIAAIVGSWFLLVPGVVASRLKKALSEMGIPEVSLEVSGLTLGSIELAAVVLGAGAEFRARRVEATFRLAGIVAGRFERVVIEDAEWDLRDAPADRSLAPFDRLVPREREGAATPSAGLDLPITQIELHRARIRLPADQPVTEIACDASLRREAGGAWHAALVVRADELTVECAGALRRVGLAWDAQLDLRVGSPEAPLELAGHARLETREDGPSASVELRAKAQRFHASLGGRELAGELRSLALAAHMSPSPSGGPVWSWNAAIELPSLGGPTLHGPRWSPHLRGLRAGGALRAHGELAVHAPERAMTFLEFDDLALHASDSWDIEGVAASVSLAGLRSISTPAHQKLTWRSLRLGEIATRAGEVSFELGPTVAIESARWAIDEQGHMATASFVIDPHEPAIATRVTLESVPIDDWLALLSRDRVHGTGRFSGWFDARVRFAPSFELDLGPGHLSAAPGGNVRFLDDPETQKMLEQHVASIGGAAVGDHANLVRQRIVESLKDFAFTALTFDLVAHDGQLDLRTHLVGKGRNVPQEFDLSVNLNGIDELLDMALDAKLGVDRARQRLQRGADALATERRTP